MATVNVKVAVRCRPMSESELARGSKCIIEMEDASTRIRPPDGGADDVRTFTFDHSYFWDCTQQGVFEDLGLPIVDKALEGYNGTIFAYGQTGSGKTHSMMGSGDDIGIIPLLTQDLFKRLQEGESETKKFLVTVSYLEIYNEVIMDLLNPSDKKLKIREHQELGIYVEGLAELVVKTAEEVEQYIAQGNSVRKVAETKMNSRSSRSHSCFTLKIEQKVTEEIGDVQRETSLKAKINLVDLAGSERASKTGATGDRLKEGAAINKSLSALGNVISVLAEGKKGQHVPYRNSKLTRLLQESLGGNALTVMIATLSPADYNYDETLSTLKYAHRAKSIKNATKKNEDVNEKLIRELREEIETLRAQLALVQGGGSLANGTMTEEEREQMKRMEEMISNLEHVKQSTWHEKERLSKLYEEERKKNLQSVDRVRDVMAQTKEQNLKILKKLKKLKVEKGQLTKEFRELKEDYAALKKSLETDLAKYETLEQEQASGLNREAELSELLGGIESKRQQLIADRERQNEVKRLLRQNDEQQDKWRAEAAAQRQVLEGDLELRRVIQQEERRKMAQERETYLEVALEEERAKLAKETATQKQKLLERFQQGYLATTKREQELHLQLLNEQSQAKMLALELQDQRKQFERRARERESEHKAELAQVQRKYLQMLNRAASTFKTEKDAMQAQLQELRTALKTAVADIEHLTRERDHLRRQLQRELEHE